VLDLHDRMLRSRLLLLLFLGLSWAPAFAAPHNIILITLDTTRADRLGFLGSQRGLTPNLDALARESVVFTRAYSHVPLTTASHATILTGTYPQFNQVNDAGESLAKDLPYAPEILRRQGYATAAFVGAVILDPSAGAPGFGRGFDTYDAAFHARRPGEDRYKTVERRGGEVVSHALAWLNRHPKGPFFLWIHLYDPHAPYDPPEPFKSRYSSAPYDGEIAYTDSVVGKLLQQLRAQHLYDDALIAVMADHGEALGEHGERGHGIFLYDPTIHVPLLFKLPGKPSAGRRVDARVGLVDVLPTILEATGAPVPKAVQGKSLAPMMTQSPKALPDRAAYAESDYPQKAYGWSALRALRASKYLFVEAPRKELYDESADPGAEHDLSSTSAAVTGTLTAQLHKFRQQTSNSKTALKAGVDPEQEAKLRALGYVASNNHQATGTEQQGADPKDKIEIANQMTDANLAIEDARYQDAISKLIDVVARDSSISPAYSALGTAWISLGDYQKALPALRKAVELRPDSVTAHYELGMALFGIGDLKSAAAEFEAAVAGHPRSADMHYSLASVYVRMNRMADAKKELGKSLALRPGHYLANQMLGQIYVVEKNPVAALPYLQKAVKAQPNSPDAHQLLADAYSQLGQKQKASQEHSLAERAKRQ
jgi:arylsulfatase A-like enzyme/Tfp pilus assembly protein PilF